MTKSRTSRTNTDILADAARKIGSTLGAAVAVSTDVVKTSTDVVKKGLESAVDGFQHPRRRKRATRRRIRSVSSARVTRNHPSRNHKSASRRRK
jgi:hypothetical protein